jgi:myosin heavy subunit
MPNPNDEQVLPTDGFDGFTDEADERADELQEFPDGDAAIAPSEDKMFEEDDIIEVEDGENSEDKEVEDKEAETQSEETTDIQAEPEQEPVIKKETKKEKFEKYSRSVQRRINKEVKQREQLRAENEQLKARFDALENKLNVTAQEENNTAELATLDNRIRNATSIKQQLLEDAEYEQVAQVDNDIMQMKIQQSKIQDAVEYKKQQEQMSPAQYQQAQQAQQQQAQYQQAQYQQAQQTQQAQAPEVPEIQANWIKGNARYGSDQYYTKYVNDVYDQMREEGYDPETQAMYTELNRRTGTKPIRPASQAPKLRPQSAPTPMTNQAQAKGPAKGLTEADKTNMRNWGMDPNDVETRKEWLRNR